MQILLTIFYKSNKVLFKILFNYPITTSIQVTTDDSVSLKTNIYEETIEKIYTSYNFDDDKLCKITIIFKIINKDTNSLQLKGLDISSEYSLNTTLRILE